jgi:rhodanese-related sulfurtransferase
MTNLDCNDIRQTMQSGATLLDVRSADEFNCGTLPDAKNIPLANLPLLAHERLDKENPVLIYCRSAGSAIIAEKILSGLGFTNVTSIGGIQHYQHCC